MPIFAPPDDPRLFFAGAVVPDFAFPLAPVISQDNGTQLIARAEPPHPDQLAGRIITARFGLAQPVSYPTAPEFARQEDRPPEPGRVLTVRPGLGSTPPARPLFARGIDALPFAGAVVVGTVGFGDTRRPVRPLMARAEDRPPEPGRVLIGESPAAPLVPQQAPGKVVAARIEERPPESGQVLSRQYGRVPSDRFVPRPTLARAEERPPAEGLAIIQRGPTSPAPPSRPTLARAEERPPEPGRVYIGRVMADAPIPFRPRVFAPEPPLLFSGWSFAAKPPAVPLVVQQRPGRACVAFQEAPRPEPGRVVILTGYAAGAIPPAPPVGQALVPGGVVRRADVSRVVRRSPRMNGVALAYVTKTKTPTEALTLVFDFTNFPEVVGGALVAAATVSGPGGAALTGLVAGPPVVLAGATVVDSQGGTVAAGKGVAVTFFGGAVGSDVIVECAAALSTGDAPKVIQAKVAVRNAV